MTLFRRLAWRATITALGGTLAAPVAVLTAQTSEYTVRFLDRTIDLRPYVQGFPYGSWQADFKSGRLFYHHITPGGTYLMVQPLRVGSGSGTIDPGAGRRVHDVDWSKRNRFGMTYDSVGGDMVLLGDERNDEVFNLYRLSLTDGSLSKLTNTEYLYGWDFSRDRRRIAYVARYGKTEPYRSCLRVMARDGSDDREVLCQQGGEQRMTWTGVNWRPDGSGVVIRLNRGGHRKQGTLAYVDLTRPAPSLDILLGPDVERFDHGSSRDEPWMDNDRFYYWSDETGYANYYVFDLRTRTPKQVTRITEDAWTLPIEVDGRQLLLVNHTRPYENEMLVLDPVTGQELGRRLFDANVGLIGFDEKNRFVVSITNAASPFRADEMWITLDAGKAVWHLEPKIRMPAQLAQAIEQCNVERVSIPTFDTDRKTGGRRALHAFLLTPKRQRANPAERLAVITAFYGGSNNYDTRQNVYCEAGISWLSPAVRGSSGFGKEFMALNDRDLGGDEIVDLFHGARFLEKRLGLRPQQIGVAGGSHGGFATMRALTFPRSTNARNESYDFGFGISHAGFSSIVTFNDATNIPDWIVLEAGDAKTEREKLLDRSPLTHVALLKAPLLLTHGANDNRVGVTESRQFYEAAKKLGKPVTYVEFEGQGHGIKGLENVVRWYRVQFEFLESVVRASKGAALTP